MKKIYILLLASALATGCVEYLPEDLLLPLDEISLSIKGEEIMRFEENSCQLGYNNRKNEFRVLNDKLTDWFILRCDTTPASTSQEVKCELEYTTQNGIKTFTELTFTVEKTDSEGFVWLWEKTKSIGLVIKVL